MSIRHFFVLRVACFVALFGSALHGDVTYKVIAQLGLSTDGTNPNPIVEANDGNFYGTTPQGGTTGCGTIFRVTPTGVLTTIYSFTGGSDGSFPTYSLVLGNNGNLYGVTINGGSNNGGTFFSISTDGVFTTLHLFDGNTEGQVHQLIKGTNGNFFGTAGQTGGGSGTFLKIDLLGNVTVLYNFNATSGGFNPEDNIVQGSDGAFYGSTTMGGTGNRGTFFRLTLAKAYSVIGSPTAVLDDARVTTLGSDGNLYGIELNTIFKMTNSGTRTTVYTFTDGGIPKFLIKGNDGSLYGISIDDGIGGWGTLFKLSGSVLTVIGNQTQDAFGPNHFIQAGDGNFYAAASPNTNLAGEIIELNAPGGSKVLAAFHLSPNDCQSALMQGSDGNFYGTTAQGGIKNGGTLFQVTPSGRYTTLFNLDPNSTGGNTNMPVVQDPFTGDLFCSTNSGGPFGSVNSYSGGSILQVHLIKGPPGSMDRVVAGQDFAAVTHGQPTSVLMARDPATGNPVAPVSFSNSGSAPPPLFYAISSVGGASEGGVIYAGVADGTITDLYNLPSQVTDGAIPQSPLIRDSAGNFYGTTENGGGSNLGTIFKITPASENTLSTFTTIHSFSGVQTLGISGDGQQPGTNQLLLGRDGLIYGTTSAGGTYNGGVVFSISPDGAETVLHSFNTDGSDAVAPNSGLIQGLNGNFYGTTSRGGDHNLGTLFSMTPAGAITILYSFSAVVEPGVIQANDGGFYGVVANNSGQVVYRIGVNEGTQAQTVTFPAIANQGPGAPPLTLNATATSGSPVNYLVSGPATLSGNTLTFTGAGIVTVTAGQPGNGTHAPAAQVTQSFAVGNPPPLVLNYNQWATLYNLADLPGLPTNSSLNDAIPNLLKFYCGIDPTVPMSASERAALPALGLDTTTNPGTTYLTMTYRENAGQSGVTMNLETSSNLQNWTPVTPDIDQPVAGGGTDSMREIGVTVTPGAHQFIRLQLAMP